RRAGRLRAPLGWGYAGLFLAPAVAHAPAAPARPAAVQAPRSMLQQLAAAVRAVPGAERLVVMVLNRMPRFKVRLARALGMPIAPADVRRIGQAAPVPVPSLPAAPAELGAHARAFHGRLVALSAPSRAQLAEERG
ncbi:MAG: hypothetical protein ACK4XK_10240, partial [Casimicrobiaceae bacterium]